MESYRVVRAADIVVDGAGETDAGDVVFFLEEVCAVVGSVAADDNESIDFVITYSLGGDASAFGFIEVLASCGAQHCAAEVDDSADRVGREWDDIIVDESLESVSNADAINVVVVASAHDGANGGVHAGRITSACEDGESFHEFSLKWS